MSTIDIRNDKVSNVTEIRFSDDIVNTTTVASTLSKDKDGEVLIKDRCFDFYEGLGYLCIANKEHATDLIKALEKAVELGWLK